MKEKQKEVQCALIFFHILFYIYQFGLDLSSCLIWKAGSVACEIIATRDATKFFSFNVCG